MTDVPEYLRAGDIARCAGVSVRTVRRWIADEDAAIGENRRRAVGSQGRTSNDCLRPHRGRDPMLKRKSN